MIPMFMGVLSIAIIMVQFLPYLFGQIITELQHIATDRTTSLASVQHNLIIYATVGICFWFFHGPGRLVEQRFAFHIRTKVMNDLYHQTQSLPLEWHQDHHSGNVTDRIKNASTALYSFAGSQFRIVSAVCNTIVPLLFLWFTARPLAIICLTGGILALLAIVRVDKILVPLLDERREMGHRLTALLMDYIANIQSIMTLRLGRQTEQELNHRILIEQPINNRQAFWNETKWGVMDIIISIAKVAVVIYLIWAFRKGVISELGIIVASVQYVQTFSGVFSNLSYLYEQTVRWASDFQSVNVITTAYTDHHRAESDFDTLNVQDIHIEGLAFAYKGSHAGSMIKDITLDFKAGQKIALVGESGSGKSTTMKVLRGLYPADAGQARLDDVIQPLGALAAQTMLIPQEPEIFENTIRYNITMGVDYADDEILEACRIACFDTVLAQMPHGLDTDIREKGVNMSGGQKQRLALARGVFAIRDSAVILLDEPTSSVDGLTEQRIYDNLFAAFPDKCVISSIHRLHLLSQFDKIYVFEKGHVIQSGTLNDLLAQSGAFNTMWQAYQAVQEKVV
jgi:ATP-binding cassette subfamily B protein